MSLWLRHPLLQLQVLGHLLELVGDGGNLAALEGIRGLPMSETLAKRQGSVISVIDLLILF